MKTKQLYQNNNFELPDIGVIEVQPFPKEQILIKKDELKQNALNKLFLNVDQQRPKTNRLGYIEGFQAICGKQNLYPLFVDFNTTRMILCASNTMVIGQYKLNRTKNSQILELLPSYQKISLSEIPTAIKSGEFCTYLGLQSGKILQYNFRTKAYEGTSDDFNFPIMQIQILEQRENKDSKIMAIDSAGNINIINFSHKTFMDKIIKTMTSSKEVSFIFRNKKREKIKKIFKGIMSNKQKQNAQTEASSSNQNFGSGYEGFPYFYTKFHLFEKKGIDKNQLLLAVFRKNILSVIILSSNFQFKRQIIVEQCFKDSKESLLGMVQFGMGGFQKSNNTHLVLTLVVQDKIMCFRTLEMQDNYEFIKISQIKHEEKIYNSTFVSNNLLVFLTENTVSIGNVNDQLVKMSSFNHQKFSYIDFFINEEKLDFDRKLIYKQLFYLFPNQSADENIFFCFMEGKRLVVGQIYTWQNFLNLSVKIQDWQKSMNYALQLYDGRLKKCGGINQNVNKRTEQMQSHLQKIVTGYFKFHINRQKLADNDIHNNEAIKTVINNCIYILLKTQSCHCLFHSFFQIISHFELVTEFMDILQVYIDQSNGYNLRISYVNQKALNILIDYYRKQGKRQLLQKLVKHFDLLVMQKLVLLTTCLKQQLYESLIFICCEQKDYITPVIKLCGIRLSNQLKDSHNDLVIKQNKRLSEIIYWYLRECLVGHFTQYGNQSSYLNMLSVLINFIFIPSSLEMLLQTSSRCLMQIINMFFEPKIMKYILENEGKFFMRKSDYFEENIFQQNCLQELKIYEKMLATLIHVIENINNEFIEFYRFEMNRLFAYIMLKNQFPFLAKIKIDVIMYYINNPMLFETNQEMNETFEVHINGHLMRLMDSLIRSIDEKQMLLKQKAKQLMINSEKIIKKIASQKQKVLNNIMDKIMVSPYSIKFIELKCYIYHELNRFGQVIELYLRMSNKILRLKIFNYLENNLSQYEELSKQFIKYMISLINLDQNKTIELISILKDQYTNHQDIITKLVDYPNIQLNYIQGLMNNKKNYDKKLLLTHLQIVLKQKSQQLENYIQKIDYPLEEAYKLCEQSNNKIGKAYILIKSGRNMEGVMMLTQIFLKYFLEYLQCIKKNIPYDAEKKQKMNKQFCVVVQTCQKQYIIDNERGEDIWQKNVEIIFKRLNVNNIEGTSIPTEIKQILNQTVSKLLKAMFQQVSTDFFLYRFSKTFGNLPFRLFIQAFTLVYDRLEFKFTLQKLDKDLLQLDQMKIWKLMMRTHFQGHVCELTCSLCKCSVQIHDKLISYSCHHFFHEECYLEHNNRKSKNELCPICYNNVDSYLICGDKKIERIKLIGDQKLQHQAKINKMKYFDRNTMFLELENEAKFQQC